MLIIFLIFNAYRNVCQDALSYQRQCILAFVDDAEANITPPLDTMANLLNSNLKSLTVNLYVLNYAL